jgi:outer membrane protein OmpA-like peptidoglycan-associated protein
VEKACTKYHAVQLLHGVDHMRHLSFVSLLLLGTTVLGGERYLDKFPNLKPSSLVNGTGVFDMPVLTWGADVSTLVANGGTTTTPDSIFGKMGLKFKIVNGDDTDAQVRAYMEGKTPWFRGTMSQLAHVSEVFGQSPATKPVVVVLESWSQGDHMVAREIIKSLNDFKPKDGKKVKIAAQLGGPHENLIDAALKAVKLKWSDVDIVWAAKLTGPSSPADLFRNDPTIDVACVITPDMLGLSTGLSPAVGNGTEGTVKGAHVVLSTAEASHVIPDIVAVRSDYFNAHREQVAKFVAGFLRANEVVMEAKRKYNDGKGKSSEYIAMLKMAQGFFGKAALPTIEVDAHGLVSDAVLARLPGNVSFFTDPGLIYGFQNKKNETINLMVEIGVIPSLINPIVIDSARWDWKEMAVLAGLEYVAPKLRPRIVAGEGTDLFPGDSLDEKTILSFTIKFGTNQQEFSPDTYAEDFKRVIEQLQVFGNTVIVVRGHADPTQTLVDFIRSGLKSGILKKTGSSVEGYRYFLADGTALDMSKTGQVLEAIQKGDFSGASPNPVETMQAALTLSQNRANQVRGAVVNFAQTKGLKLDLSQIQASGVGMREPIIPKPKNKVEAGENMRVEFRLLRVPAEAVKDEDFDLLKEGK